MKTFNDLASCLIYIAEEHGADTLLNYERLRKLLDEMLVLEPRMFDYSHYFKPIFEEKSHIALYQRLSISNDKGKAISRTLEEFMRENVVRAYITGEGRGFYERIQDRYPRKDIEHVLRIYADALWLAKKNIEERDKIRGCLIGGAAGDALGYAVEFIELEEIRSRYSPTGITSYNLDNELGKAIISDDTQMTLFTAYGILVGATRGKMRGISASLESYIYRAYLKWLQSQTGKRNENDERRPNWLLEIPELCVPRHPGTTCIHALHSGKMGTIEEPINDSKGCGGVMRVAPVALYFKGNSFDPLDGARAAAITHGHPLGYIPATAFVTILHRIVYGGCTFGDTLYDIVDECCDFLQQLYAENKYINELLDKINLAKELSRNDKSDAENIHRIGGGWTGDDALAIALYCSLKYYNDFSAAIIAAVNHDGDSDSTGSITGNIVGAHIGYENIPAKWKQNLQLHDLILEIADDLFNDCQMEEENSYFDEKWRRKYSC